MPALPAKDQIQKLVAHGFDFNHSRWILLRVQDAILARGFIAQLAQKGWVCPAADSREQVSQRLGRGQCPVSLGLTYAGLESLQLRPHYLDVLRRRARAFAQGAERRAAEFLGDTGQSAAGHWAAPYRGQETHLVLILHGDGVESIEATVQSLQAIAGAAFVADSWQRVEKGAHLTPDPKFRTVHFGLRDGISNPAFPELMSDSKPVIDVLKHATGELLLGYPDDRGNNPWLLGLERPEDGPARGLGEALPAALDMAAFFRNASFGALRKIEQDEPAFRQFVTHWAERNGHSDETEQKAHYLRAKMVGRWDDGSLVLPGQTAPGGAAAALNHFDFAHDAQGLGCPFGAHIRRMNPRADPVVPVRHRPLMRRGIPYGPEYRAAENEEAHPVQRGLMGLFFCTDLEGQFEHLLREWVDLNPMGTPNQGDSKDPLIGAHDHPLAAFDIPQPGEARLQVDGLRPFVRTVGTLYAIFPGLQALRQFDDPTLFRA